MVYILIVIVCFVLPSSIFFAFLFKLHKSSNGLTVLEMMKYEKKVAKDYPDLIEIGIIDGCDGVAKQLKLYIEPSPCQSLGGVDSLLCPPDSHDCSGYNGIIRYARSDDRYGRDFRCYHEIIHYLEDVGKEKIVRKSYGKNRTGETRSHREQIINYMAAALAIPRDDLLQEIAKYPGSHDSDDFIDKLQSKYHQPKVTIKRRINEVILLSQS